MSSDWPVTSIADIASKLPGSLAVGPFGSRMKADLYVPSGVRVIRGNNLNGGKELAGEYVHVSEQTADSLASCCLSPGDLVFPHRGNIGQVGIAPDDGKRYMLSTSLMKLSPDRSKADPLYLMYFFKSAIGRAALLMNASQVGTPGIATPLKSLRGIQLSLPSLLEQRKIAEMLASFDDRITILGETNATLEAIAQALFKSWFVHFDPVRAKMEGRAPDGMDEATAALFPDSLEESELDLVPKGWVLGCLADLAKLNPESWTTKNHPDFVAYIDLANAKNNEISEITVFEFSGAPSRARRVLRDGDTIVGTVRPGNRSFAFISQADTNLTASTGFAVLRPRKVENTEFIYLAATQDTSIEYLANLADGGAYPAIRPDVVSNIQSVLPGSNVMAAFHDAAAPLLLSIAENQRRVKTLASLRDTLLPRLIYGQLRLPEIDSLVEEALI